MLIRRPRPGETMKLAPLLLSVTGAFLFACGGGESDGASAGRAAGGEEARSDAVPLCRVADPGTSLPHEVRESSGLAQGRRDPDVFWTHNDAGHGPELFALDGWGRLVQRVRVTGAAAVDWEDIASGPCAEGDCLFIGDIGDNRAGRERITIYRVPEPERGASATAPAVALHATYPAGPRDAESLFVLPTGELFLVSKGRGGPIILYRYPPPQRPGETVVLERVRQLLPRPAVAADRITGASATPDGRWVGIRSYRSLYLYRTSDLLADGAGSPAVIDLRPLREPQGEGVAISNDGVVRLSSEAENRAGRPRWSRLTCTLPEP